MSSAIICGDELREETREYWANRDNAQRRLNEYYAAHGYANMVRPLPSDVARGVAPSAKGHRR